jgi:hypothetical protein
VPGYVGLELRNPCASHVFETDGGGGVTGGERTGGDLGGPRETDCVPGHIGLEPANPSAIYLIGIACATTAAQPSA